MNSFMYSDIDVGHRHDDDGESSKSLEPAIGRSEGWYLNPFDCREEMYWSGSSWGARRTSNANDPVDVGFRVDPAWRDARIRAEIFHRRNSALAEPPPRVTVAQLVVVLLGGVLLLLSFFVLPWAEVLDPSFAGKVKFLDLRSDYPDVADRIGFAFSYLSWGFIVSCAAYVGLVSVAGFGRSQPFELGRFRWVFAGAFGALGLWELLMIRLLAEADREASAILLGAWLGPVGHLLGAIASVLLMRVARTSTQVHAA